jgi:hypothetical protein
MTKSPSLKIMGVSNSRSVFSPPKIERMDFTGWETDNNKVEYQFKKVARALRTDDFGREMAPESRL